MPQSLMTAAVPQLTAVADNPAMAQKMLNARKARPNQPWIASKFLLDVLGYLKPINCLDPDSGKDFYTYMQEKRRWLPPFIPACMYRRVRLKITNGWRFAWAWIWHELR